MTRIKSLWAALVAGLLTSLFIPAVAWAEESGAADIARKAPKIGGFFGIFGALCCLVVVGGIVLVVFLVMKNRKR